MDQLSAEFSFDTERAIRDPLFWVCIAIDKISFGLIDTGRWRRYVIVNPGGQND